MSVGKLSTDFKVESGWLQLPPFEKILPHDKKELKKVYARKELPHLANLEKITEGQKAYQTQGGTTRDKILETLSKVIAVILPILSVLMPLAACYLPAWVPLGIGLPLSLILSIVQSELKSRLEMSKKAQEFIPHFASFLKHPNLKAFQFISVADLPAKDERLKSDKLMAKKEEMADEEAKKRHLLLERPTTLDSRFDLDGKTYTQHRVATIANCYDLEVTPYLQQAVAAEHTDSTQVLEKWGHVRNVQKDIMATAEDNDLKEFSDKIKIRRELAFASPLGSQNHLVDYPDTTVRSYIHPLYELYNRSFLQLDDLDALRKEGEALYGTSAVGWEDYITLLKDAKDVLAACQKNLASRLNEVIFIDFSEAQLIFYRLNAQTHLVKTQLKEWIAAHPLKRYQAIQTQLKDYYGSEVLTAYQLGVVFAEWVEENPDLLDQTILKIGDAFPKELEEWVEKHSNMRFKTVRDLFSRSIKAFESLQEAKESFKDLEVELEAIDTFEKTVMAQLSHAIRAQSEAMDIRQKLKATFTIIPAIPFAKVVIPQEPFSLKMRTFEEVHLNKLLQEIDSRMLFTHRVRKYGLRMPLVALFAIEGIVAYYLATHWVLWSFCVLAALGEGVSYYFDKKLQEMERKKHAIKLQYILRDHPDIGVIPGTKPHLYKVKEVQQNYGLDGVRSTWARVLAEENLTPLESASNLEEAKSVLYGLKEEIDEMTTPILNQALLDLYTEQKALLARYNENKFNYENKMRAVFKNIESMERDLKKEASAHPEGQNLLDLYRKQNALLAKYDPKNKNHVERIQSLNTRIDEKEKESAHPENKILLDRYREQKKLFADYNQKHSNHVKSMQSLNKRIVSMEKSLYGEEKKDLESKLQEDEKYFLEQSQKAKNQNLKKGLDKCTQLILKKITKLSKLNYKQSHFDNLKEILPSNFFEFSLSEEEKQNYLLGLDESKRREHSHALQRLSALQRDEKVPTPSAVEAKQKALKDDLEKLYKEREEWLQAYKKIYKKAYAPLARERQMLEAAQDKLAENKVYMETKLKEFYKIGGQFARLERVLTPQFVKEPVIQAEIDLLLETLKMEPLEQDPAINVMQLLRTIKEKLNAIPFRWIFSNNIKFRGFDAEIEQLLRLPAADRLALAKLLRKLQRLQNDRDYQSRVNVNDSEALATEKLNEMQHEIDLLNKRYDDLTLQMQKA